MILQNLPIKKREISLSFIRFYAAVFSSFAGVVCSAILSS